MCTSQSNRRKAPMPGSEMLFGGSLKNARVVASQADKKRQTTHPLARMMVKVAEAGAVRTSKPYDPTRGTGSGNNSARLPKAVTVRT